MIGKAIDCSRRLVDFYIVDLKAATEMELDLKLFRMHLLGIPQVRIAKRLGARQKIISSHLVKMETFPFLLDAGLSRGYTVLQVAEKH